MRLETIQESRTRRYVYVVRDVYDERRKRNFPKRIRVPECLLPHLKTLSEVLMLCDDITSTRSDMLDDFNFTRSEINEIKKFAFLVDDLQSIASGHNAEKTQAFHQALKETRDDDICEYYEKRLSCYTRCHGECGREKVLNELKYHLRVDRRRMKGKWRAFIRDLLNDGK